MRDVLADQALIVITPQDYMQDARNRFERYPNIDQIVVVELLNPVGILTRDDLLRWMYEEELMKSD